MTKVIKRDGREVEFNESKIELAILNAMAEIEYLSEDVQDIVENIIEQIENEEVDCITVEEIQEIVVGELYSLDKRLGKVYNDYRNKQNINRQNKIEYKLLSEEFISKYKHLSDPFPTDMSAFVFYRTYSRFLPKENRRERWWEVVARVVEYNCSLAPTFKEEAEELYDNIYNLRQFPSGRSLWVANTEVSKKYPMSNFNCSFNILNNFNKFVESFYLLLIGAGVGFRVLPEDVIKLPMVRTDIEIIDQYYKPVNKNERKELTEYTFPTKNIIKIIIGDSKEAWVQALNIFLKVHYDKFYRNINTIVIDYNNIRKAGEPLKTFGGTASGHESMQIMLNKISKVIKKCTNKINDIYIKLKPIDCTDIANILGENVVSGGVRRCLPKGSLVHTKEGLISIENVKIGMEAKTSDGYSKITDWVYQGKQKLLTINTQLGEFKCTPKHKMAVMTSVGNYEWKMAKDLIPYDRLVFVKNGIRGKKTKLPDYKRIKKEKDTNSIDISIPELNEDFAWFLGYFHGNGYVNNKELSIVIPYGLEDYITKIENVFKSFNVYCSINNVLDEHCYKIRVKSVQLAEYMGQWKQPNTCIKVPNFIQEGLENIRVSYLLGLYDADGSTKGRPIISVTSIYKEYLKEIQSLYASVGIVTRLKKSRESKDNWKALYVLKIVGEKEKKDFEQIVVLNSIKYKSATKTERSNFDYGYPSEWFKNDYKSWNKNNKQMTVARYEKIFDNKQNLIPIEVLSLDYSDDNLYETYDISVNKKQEFVCECGLLVHNTAEIVIFDEKDTEMIQAKTNLYKQINGQWVVDNDIIHRQMSNNSIFYIKKPIREQLHWQIEQMRYSGEPAFINQESASKRRENYNGCNACAEILLDDNGMCNLTEIVPLRFIENGILNEDKLYQAQKLSARMGYRMTCVDFELHDWDYINKRDRLIGCSITGWQDFVNILNLSNDEQIRILTKLKQIAIDESNKLADELRQNKPVLHTTNKPSGTISLLPNVSSGVHYSHSEFYIRRIRINALDPLALALKDMGYQWKPEVGQTKDNCKTIVIEFPMKAPKGKTKYDVTAIEQLENYKMFMSYYANHNVSITVTVRDNEWEEVEQWLWDNWDDVVAVSFIPLNDAMYELMPYEEITEEQYKELIIQTPKFNPSLLSKYEKGEDFEVTDSDCDGGICPIK